MARKIAVCDDEKTMLRQISLYLEQIQQELGETLHTFYFSSAEEVLAHMDRSADILLLDISMGGITGMECAEKLRDEGFEGEILFITSMEEYALKGYSVHAFAFLTKPVTYAELRQCLADCFKRLDKKKPVVYAVETANGTVILKISEIISAEVYQHHTSFNLKSGKTLESAIQLNEVEETLAKNGFFRCHRSYLVNMKHIKKIAPAELTLSDGSVVPLSKHRNRDFLDTYTRFMGVELK